MDHGASGQKEGGPQPAEGVVLVDLPDLDRVIWDQLTDTVLRPSFPPDELMTADEMYAYTDPANVLTGLVAMRDGEPVGVILGDYFPASRVALLAYLAARPDQRSLGIGRRLVDAAVPRWWKAARPNALLLEVDDPRIRTDTEFGDPVRRLRFYGGSGARVIDHPYTQPSLRPGLSRVPGMLLLEMGSPDDSMDASVLTDFLTEYYAGCEGEDALRDPDFREVLAPIEAAPDGRVPLRDVYEWLGTRAESAKGAR
jgi:GNAT superfamily N-acetyltransferase